MIAHQIVGNAGALGGVAVKAVLLFVTALIAFRIAERRTLAEMGPYDFIAAVASGAILGRVPNSTTTSYLEGAVTLIAILIVHTIVTRLRYVPGFTALVDHPPRLLVSHGQILERELRHVGLTHKDLFAVLRQHNVHQLGDVRYVIFEERGKVSVVPQYENPNEPDGAIVAIARQQAPTAKAGAPR